jgi:hypothetical protein
MHAIIFTGYERSGGLERVSGAYRIATVLRKEGWDVEVIDFFYYWHLDQLKDLIKNRSQKYKLDWIGFSSTWINYSSEPVQDMMVEFLKFVKKSYPDTVTIAGGQNPSVHFPIYDNIDYIIGGFGEVAIIKVLDYIFNKGPAIKGIPRKNGWYVDANAFYQAWPIKDLSIEYEPRDFIHHNETLALEFSRGCKFACAFCNFPVLGVKEDTTRDIGSLKEELRRNYYLYGVTNYQVADETLNDRDEKLEKIAEVVKGLSFDVNFSAFIRADILFSRPQQLKLLADARVWAHYYGIETFNHETGKVIGKGMHPDKIKEGLLNTKKFFNDYLGLYRGTVSLVYGLPKETKESIISALEWLCENWSDQNVIAFPLNISLTGNKSKIDENYEKYGYTIMGQEKRKLYNRHNFFSNDLTIWENENMNMYDAIELVDKEIADFKPGFLDSWKLFSMMSLTDSVEQALLLNESDATIDMSHFHKPNGGHGELGTITKTNSVKQEPLRQKAKDIKAEYVTKKLSL